MNYLRTELLDHLAATYVLGTLRGPARRRFERLCRQSAAARMVVQKWETQLSSLATSVPSHMPSPQLWLRIATRLGHTEPADQAAAWWRILTPTLSFACGLMVAVGLLQLYPGMLPGKAPTVAATQTPATPNAANSALPASYVGLLLDAHGEAAVLASSLRHGKVLSIKLLQPLDVPQDKVATVWSLSKTGVSTRLGVVPKEGKRVIDMTATSEELLSSAVKLLITLENAEHTPTTPSAPLLIGHCVKLW